MEGSDSPGSSGSQYRPLSESQSIHGSSTSLVSCSHGADVKENHFSPNLTVGCRIIIPVSDGFCLVCIDPSSVKWK
jgi:hypothetical protein